MRQFVASLAVFCAVVSPRAAAAEERYALIVSGVSGSEKFAASQKTWIASLQSTLQQRLGFAAERITVLSESGAGEPIANRENVTRTLASLKSRLTADDTLLVVLIGHGTYDGTAAKFNLVGPDMDSREWKASLDGNPARLVFVNTTSSSFQFVPGALGQEPHRDRGDRLGRAEIRHDVSAVLHRSARPGREGRQRQERPPVGVGSVHVRQPGREAGVRAAGDARHRAIGHRRQRRWRRQRSRGATGTDGVLAKTTFLDPLPAASVGERRARRRSKSAASRSKPRSNS